MSCILLTQQKYHLRLALLIVYKYASGDNGKFWIKTQNAFCSLSKMNRGTLLNIVGPGYVNFLDYRVLQTFFLSIKLNDSK